MLNKKIFLIGQVCGLLFTTSQAIAANNPASTTYVENYVQNYVDQAMAAPRYTVGQIAQGGVVFYVDASGQHGLVLSLQNLTTHLPWSVVATSSVTGASNQAYGGGSINTALILAREASMTTQTTINSGFAAFNASQYFTTYSGTVCTPSSSAPTDCLGGWYMPNYDEFETAAQALCNANIAGFTPLSETNYWLSEETNNTQAYYWGGQHDLSTCSANKYAASKTNTGLTLRAVRQF